jgi:hypothetical protein
MGEVLSGTFCPDVRGLWLARGMPGLGERMGGIKDWSAL